MPIDDATAVGNISDLKKWLDNLSKVGPFYPNNVASQKVASSASQIFGDGHITTEGQPNAWFPHRLHLTS